MNKKDDALISIAMCTFNGECFLSQQLDSLINQSYKNTEIVIVDDCSTDNTVNIINNYQQKDNRIKLFQNEKNLGFVKNFDKAISLCKGDYIALADQDDIWKENKLELFKKKILNNILIYSDAEIIDKYSKQTGNQFIRPINNLVSGKCNKSFLLGNCVSGNTMMFKKKLLNYILPIPTEFSYHDIWIAFIASTIGTITYTDEAMTYYRRHQKQITVKKQKKYLSIFDWFRKKKNNEIKSTKQKSANLYCLNKLHFIDKNTKKTINLLKYHTIDYQKGYFNSNLFKHLIKNKNEIFATVPTNKRTRYAIKQSLKLKGHMLILFS